MNKGIHSTIEYLAHKLLQRRVPKWYEAFCDQHSDGFYERLGKGFQPVYTGNRRLLTHCRQLALYSHAVAHKENRAFRPDLTRHYAHMVDTYYVAETGGWRFSVDDEGNSLDDTNDLYALAFVIFSLSHYYRATGDEKAQVLARATLDFIRNHMRISDRPGFAEAVSADLQLLERPRRQNPHMHLLEACLFAGDTWRDPNYLDTADEIIYLFYEYFFDKERVFLGEYYQDNLSRDPETGHAAEPGHYFEWVWLLKKHASAIEEPDMHNDACSRLLMFANSFGWDREFGGIYDEFNVEGQVLKPSKRIWPFAEALKANVLMLDSGADKKFLKKRVAEMVKLFRKRYMDERGFWTEWLSRDLSPVTDYLPGTTPYHVYFGVMETLAALRQRGANKSITLQPVKWIYSLRRNASSAVRGARPRKS